MFRGGLGQQAVASAVLASLGLAWLLVGAAIDATAAFMAFGVAMLLLGSVWAAVTRIREVYRRK